MEDKEVSNMFEIKILPEGQVNTLQLAPPKKPQSPETIEYNLARSEARRKKKEEERKKKEERLKKLNDNRKYYAEERKKKEEEDKKKEEKDKKLKEERERERENLRRLADLDEKSENSNNAAPELREYISKNWGKTLVFGGLAAIKKEEKERKKEEEKEKKRQFVAAKRSCDLEFLLPYYENLIEKEVKKEEEKEKNKENEEKIEEAFQKIYEKYNKKYKEIIKDNKGRVEALYNDFPRELPKHVPISVTRRDFFKKLFARREKKEEVPVEFILANKDKKWFERKATNKKYYDSHKPSLSSSFYQAGASLGGFYSSYCEDMLAIKEEKEKEKENEENEEEESLINKKREREEEEDEDDEEEEEIIVGGIKKSDVFDKLGRVKDFNLLHKFEAAIAEEEKKKKK